MKTLIPHILFLFGLISLQASCQKSEPKPLILNDPEFLSYWFFPAGSYWIYEDSISGALDTFLIETANVWEQNNKYGDNILQRHGLSVINKGKVFYQVGMPWPYSEKEEGLYDLDIRTSDGNYFFRFFYYKDQNINTPYQTTQQTLYKSIIDSLNIKAKTYYSIQKIQNVSSLTTDSLIEEYYAKNIGVLKRVYKGIKVWELKEYYIAP